MKDYFGYAGQTCVVTGAASGMGRATCEMLIDLGAEVYALDVAEVTLPVKKFIKCNLGDKASIDAAFQELPQEIDKFFGIAGVSGVVTDFKTTVMINFIGNKYITEEYLAKRVKSGGAIAYMASLGGRGWLETREEFKDVIDAKTWGESVSSLDVVDALVAQKGYGKAVGLQGYRMSKRMMIYFSKKIIQEFAKKDIRVNVVNPGQTQTQLTDEWATLLTVEQMRGSQDGVTRAAVPMEMAGPIVFANSDMATYMSGVDIFVDYGQMGMSQYFNPDEKPGLISY